MPDQPVQASDLSRHRGFGAVVRFATVGVSGLIVDLAVLSVLVSAAHVSFHVGRPIAFVSAMTSNFVFNRMWTFRVTGGDLFRQYLRYAAGATLALGVNWVVSSVLFETFELFQRMYQLAALLGVIAGFGFNFVFANWIVFPNGKHWHSD